MLCQWIAWHYLVDADISTSRGSFLFSQSNLQVSSILSDVDSSAVGAINTASCMSLLIGSLRP